MTTGQDAQGLCRNGAQHYCPNCDNTFVAASRATPEPSAAEPEPQKVQPHETSSAEEKRRPFHFHRDECYAVGPGDTEVLVCQLEGRRGERNPIKRLHNLVDSLQACDRCHESIGDGDSTVLCEQCAKRAEQAEAALSTLRAAVEKIADLMYRHADFRSDGSIVADWAEELREACDPGGAEREAGMTSEVGQTKP